MDLTYPPAETTSRPDIPVADAYLIDGADYEIVDADYFSLPFASDVEHGDEVTPLLTLWSVDHGLRTGDETSAVIGINCAAEVIGPLIRMCGGDPTSLDWWGTMCTVLDLDGWTGGWLDETHGDFAHEGLYEWSRDMESAAGDAGIIVETSADAGMTWGYAPLCEPISHPND